MPVWGLPQNKLEIVVSWESLFSCYWTPRHLRKVPEPRPWVRLTKNFCITSTRKTASPELWKIVALRRNLHNCISSQTYINFRIISYIDWSRVILFVYIYIYMYKNSQSDRTDTNRTAIRPLALTITTNSPPCHQKAVNSCEGNRVCPD